MSKTQQKTPTKVTIICGKNTDKREFEATKIFGTELFRVNPKFIELAKPQNVLYSNFLSFAEIIKILNGRLHIPSNYDEINIIICTKIEPTLFYKINHNYTFLEIISI